MESEIYGYEILTRPREYLVLKLAEEQKPKTQVWNVMSKHHDVPLGVLKWYAPWRQYCFFPAFDTVWSKSCLNDIEFYLGALNTFHKEKHRKA